MKMNGCIILCFLLLITLSMSQSFQKRSKYIEDKNILGDDVIMKRAEALISKRGSTWKECKQWRKGIDGEQECKNLGCEYFPPKQSNKETCSKKVETGGSCFPASAMVTTRTGNAAMETLNIGDSVLTVLGNGIVGFTKVVADAQREADKQAHFLSITTVNQAGYTRTVKLSVTHNIYVKSRSDDDHDAYIPRFAEDVFIGDVLKTQTDNGTDMNEATVTHVALHKEMGVFAPLTETGTMLVDGTLVSCYASFNDKMVHILTAPIRWLPWLFVDEGKPLQGTLPYVEVIKYIGHHFAAPFASLK